MKKFASLVGAGALLLGMAVPAFAWFPWGPMIGSDNVAMVENSAVAIADTGGNTQNASAWKGGDVEADGTRGISTGNASAYAGALVVANTHIGCGLCTPAHDDDVALVENGAMAAALTGGNEQDAKAWKGGDVDADGIRSIVTGDADSTARAWVIVNTHWTGSYFPLD